MTEVAAFSGCKPKVLEITTTFPAIGVATIKAIICKICLSTGMINMMTHDDLKTGRLIRLYPELQCASALAYYVVYRSESQSLAKLSAFRDWLKQEAKAK
ncbi:hypothetical protein [Acinetobacter sp. GXMZU3951]